MAEHLCGGRSVRQRLLLWLALPVALFILVDAWASYRAALDTAQRAFDRLLVTSAHALADLIRLEGGTLQITLPHAALELYGDEAGLSGRRGGDVDTRSRMIYRVSYLDGEYLAGERAVAPYVGLAPMHPRYGVRLALYGTRLADEPVRMAALWQPVETHEGLRYVVVQVGEPSTYRDRIARGILWQTLGRQALLLAVLLVLIWCVATVALRPLRGFARQLEARTATDLEPVAVQPQTPQELLPVVSAFNGLLERARETQAAQQRFVADASHQLRTPLAVLKLQAHAGLAREVPEQEALEQVSATIERTSRVVQQLLTWSRARAAVPCDQIDRVDLRDLLEEVAVELSPLLAARHHAFQFEAVPCPWEGPTWMVREIATNLLHNALRYTAEGGTLGLRLVPGVQEVCIVVHDDGPGLSPQMERDLFVPFVSGDARTRGAGLGLAICRDLAHACGGRLDVRNRRVDGLVQGLDALVWLSASPHRCARPAIASKSHP
ncbi:two-component system, OmpR family, sensor histidine kinase TctE [Oryzisolibacter propanilivorax]|uniref:histidine kinase n=1 Tax=Oryzisolibacter propanilivorax TaxID=1527607 RepID=A0A1G9Q3N4_9BURK|nr:sensor histidine kinase [Oryzisolibacter propanilivorax]SDM04945.1 two-component system, OmpR family, sensor histidine kinase TctE [Oryzisolibacter propanilivorax]